MVPIEMFVHTLCLGGNWMHPNQVSLPNSVHLIHVYHLTDRSHCAVSTLPTPGGRVGFPGLGRVSAWCYDLMEVVDVRVEIE